MSLLLKAGQITLGTGRKTLVPAATMPSHTGQTDQPEQAAILLRNDLHPDAQIESLRSQLAELEHAHEEQALRFETLERAAYQRGVEEGIAKGLARAEHDYAAMVSKLEAGVQEALTSWRERLQSVEVLALDVAQAALEKILGDAASYATLVVQTVRHHLAQTASGAAIGIQVSAIDFPDIAQLDDAFAALTRNTPLTVKADPQLRSGACLIELTLGRLDLSLPQQMARVSTVLDGLHADD